MLTPDTFKVTLSFSDMKIERFDYYENLLSFTIDEYQDSLNSQQRGGIIRPSNQFVMM